MATGGKWVYVCGVGWGWGVTGGGKGLDEEE